MPEVTNDATCSYLDCGAVRHEPAAGARASEEERKKSQKWEREALGKGITAARGPFSTLTNRVVSLT
ncbi:hypothetical protein PV325_002016 [Microctonus aethiopoides]|uniref:Uncharacterized protein n=1 Tax=Microctonus aethiopoides TaxID=144406 RepID=A0AA39FKI5_9HYME|nr:hypothetical protein PV325_002016 [Microctonus aethiopoides]KAK0171126.1 hypothetical protein PV328_008883 [Microctonus aethiopoides]